MSQRPLDICIVGAGISGLLMGIRLKEAGIEGFRIFEKASSLGGTWRENTYPGLTCDVPSFFHSYSFRQNLDWSHRFSPGPEILAYFERVAQEHDLERYITFDAKITSARYEDGRWEIEAGNGERISADVLITATGALHQWHYPDIDGLEKKGIADRCRAYMAGIEDPELRRKLTPDYEPMCKRLIISRDFVPTLMKEHVDLVTDGVERVEAGGVRTKDGTLHELDILVLATGFDTHAWGIENLVGEGGVTAREAWAEGTRAYYSVAMPGFPNMFMLVGPNSPIGNISLIDVSEVQAEYIMKCVDLLRKGKAKSLAPTAEATRAFHEKLLDAMKDTVWVTGCNSWYLDDEGIPNTWPWTASRFHKEMSQPRLDDFDLHGSGADERTQQQQQQQQ